MRALNMELTEACRYLFLFNGEKIRVGNLIIVCTGQGKGEPTGHPLISTGSL